MADIEKVFVRLTNQKIEKRLNDVVKPEISQFVYFFLVNHFQFRSVCLLSLLCLTKIALYLSSIHVHASCNVKEVLC